MLKTTRCEWQDLTCQQRNGIVIEVLGSQELSPLDFPGRFSGVRASTECHNLTVNITKN